MQITNNLIIGVKPLDPMQRASVTGAPAALLTPKLYLPAHGVADMVGACTSAWAERKAENPPIVPEPAAPRVAAPATRSYVMDKPHGGPGTLTGIAPEASVWTKIQHYVIGA